MLNNLKLKLKKSNLSKHYKKTSESVQAKQYLAADKEWFNSVYAYNKNTLSLLPVADKIILKSIKSYFNLYSRKLESKARIRSLYIRFRKLSINRILVSKAELKHSSDKVTITVYVYNNQRSIYLSKLIDVSDAIINLNEEDYIIKNTSFSNKLLKQIKEKCLKVMKNIFEQKKSFAFALSKRKETLNENNKFISYERKYLKKLLFKCLKKEMLLMHMRQIIYFNKSKFEKTSFLPLINLIKNVYKKKVEFNLVNIKYLYLNSYIFLETLLTKIRKKKNTLDGVLMASLNMLELEPQDKLSTLYSTHKKVVINSKVDYLESKTVKKNTNLKTVLKKSPVNALNGRKIHEEYITSNVLDYIKYKYVTGIKIEAAGRFSRRSGAAKSLSKFTNKGNIRNIDSSYKGFPSVLLRGYARSNVQYTRLNSILRNGSFGLKGWVGAN